MNQAPDIELFTFGSTNGHKVAMALEELELDYVVRPKLPPRRTA